ncbi:hypothetical protein JB92DRAFT_2774975, partial [Gautieria morchelliformis]
VWHNLHTTLTDQEHDLFVTQLDSTSIEGLSVPPIHAGYMPQYHNGLMGKHFKVLMQTAMFHVHGLVSDAQFKLIKAVGQVGALMWYHIIPHMTTYIADLHILIQNVLHVFDLVDPARMIDNGKLHILTHLPDEIQHFGPAIRYATEVFECFNHVFRMCSILSNHQAPGHDIACKYTSME